MSCMPSLVVLYSSVVQLFCSVYLIRSVVIFLDDRNVMELCESSIACVECMGVYAEAG